MKRSSLYALIPLLLLLVAAPAFSQTYEDQTTDISEANKVSYWCEDGIKYEPVDTPFIVPAPPAGTTWTLIVLKGGTTNETHANPTSGQSYSHSAHDNSHVILCWEGEATTDSTVPDSTTTTAPETTTSSSTTSTVPVTSTSTQVGSTTTTSLPTTTSTAPVPTTVPPSTTLPEVSTDLPETGANVTVLGLIGMALLLTGGFVLAVARADR